MKANRLKGIGKIYDDKKTIIMKKEIVETEIIKKHNHKGYNVFLNVLYGNVSVKLNDIEIHELKDEEIINFDGETFVEIQAIKKSLILVYLVKKDED